MSLRDYNRKRSFTKTPEPKGKAKETTGPLTFVIQKHHASRLHYDFRLELNGVLKSWAVPRGPSLNPDDVRLAVMVEDHPMDYATFEGIIPEGQYGGGTVMVWDRGVYQPMAAVDRQKAEKMLTEQINKGHLSFLMLGEKLQGEFALVKTKGEEENSWLLIKANDEYAGTTDVLENDKSVITGRSMDEIKNEAGENDIWLSKPKGLRFNDIPKSDMPHDIKPMLAQATNEPFNNEEWVFEIKYDGYRAIFEKEKADIKLYSRNGVSYTKKFSPIVDVLKNFPADVILDGEIVMVDSHGRPHFQWLQDYPSQKNGELIYVVFDMLHYDGHNLMSLSLHRRKKLLKEILPSLPHIRYSEHIEGDGVDMFSHIKTLGVEGVMAKKKNSIYTAGTRSHEWLKIKILNREEFIICGFTQPKGGRSHFGSLILGEYKKDGLSYVGHVGGGFNETVLKNIYTRLQPLIQEECPFEVKPETNTPATWLKPELLAEVSFSNRTQDGQLRHPIFLGLREDKTAEETNGDQYFAKDPIDKEGADIKIENQTLHLSNLTKVFWPHEGYTKGDLVTYYREIAPVILPYLQDRPESLLRYPDGINGKSFYQKDSATLDADWIEKIVIHSDSTKKDIAYILCQNEATLMYLINLGCIDLNPWSSRKKHLDHPDYLLIDLDPEDISFEQVVETALAVREVLEKLEIESFVKTSGAKGMHIYIPLGAGYTYEQSRTLAELLCIQVYRTIPDITSLKRNPKERQGLVYLDYLQNIQGQTLASVYSVRAQPGATVSTPLLWEEVTKKLHPSQFTIKNIPKRIQKHGDIFKGVLGKGIDIGKVLDRLSG